MNLVAPLDAVTISSGTMTLTLQRHGADVTSIILAPTGDELLWQSGLDAETLSQADDDRDFFQTYPGGIQDLFPNAGDSTRVLGAQLPFHGEAHRRTWSVSANEREIVAETYLRGLPFTLRKRVWLDANEPVARFELHALNGAPQALPYHLGFHPAFSARVTASPAFVVTEAEGFRSGPTEFSERQSYPPHSIVPSAKRQRGSSTRLLDPGAGTADLAYADPREGWCVVVSEATNLAVGMTWPIELLPALWLWQECAGTTGYPWWGREHIVAVEPHTSWPSRPLDVEIAEGAASWIEPGEGISATFSLRAERCAPGELDDFVSRTRADALSTRDGVNQEEE